MASDSTARSPGLVPELAPFWEEAARGKLVLPQCEACEQIIWYPRPFCPSCMSINVKWLPASGDGTVYSFGVYYASPHPDYADRKPYVLAYVTLKEGPTIMTNIVDCDPAGLSIGQRVTVTFSAAPDGRIVPRFRPT